jgi:hypothetical protein
MADQEGKSPAEFTKDMPEDDLAHGDGAGEGAPETVEPRTGRPGPGGEGPDGEAPERKEQSEDADD